MRNDSTMNYSLTIKTSRVFRSLMSNKFLGIFRVKDAYVTLNDVVQVIFYYLFNIDAHFENVLIYMFYS